MRKSQVEYIKNVYAQMIDGTYDSKSLQQAYSMITGNYEPVLTQVKRRCVYAFINHFDESYQYDPEIEITDETKINMSTGEIIPEILVIPAPVEESVPVEGDIGKIDDLLPEVKESGLNDKIHQNILKAREKKEKRHTKLNIETSIPKKYGK